MESFELRESVDGFRFRLRSDEHAGFVQSLLRQWQPPQLVAELEFLSLEERAARRPPNHALLHPAYDQVTRPRQIDAGYFDEPCGPHPQGVI
jgi:hypothetical protein